jgi:hypothetical protein
MCEILPCSVEESSDDGQYWPKHVKVCLYIFILKLVKLDRIITHIQIFNCIVEASILCIYSALTISLISYF